LSRSNYSAADMSRPAQVAEMVEQGVARFGSLDLIKRYI
jgi:NAD(P)-dependent dehydrogenase (short-subunit alcohol dehydrogenase family)